MSSSGAVITDFSLSFQLVRLMPPSPTWLVVPRVSRVLLCMPMSQRNSDIESEGHLAPRASLQVRMGLPCARVPDFFFLTVSLRPQTGGAPGAGLPTGPEDLETSPPAGVDSPRKPEHSFAQKERTGQTGETFQSSKDLGDRPSGGIRGLSPLARTRRSAISPKKTGRLRRTRDPNDSLPSQPLSLVAQLAEQRIVNPCVAGSNPARGAASRHCNRPRS